MFNFFVKTMVDKDSVSYLPTSAGYIALGLLFVLIILIAVFFRSKSAPTKGKSIDVRALAFCAMSIALAFVCSYIKVFKLPTGGSITLFSMFFVTFAAYLFGLRTGLLAAFAYGLLQLIADPFVVSPQQLILDYCLAFTALGLAGLFAKSKHGMIKGYIVGIIGRFIFATMSGYFFFGSYAWEGWNPLPYSLAYNASYIFAEGAITLVLLAIPAVSSALAQVKRIANID